MRHRSRTRCLSLLLALLFPLVTPLGAAEPAVQDAPPPSTEAPPPADPPTRPPAVRLHNLLIQDERDIEAISNLLTRHPHIVNEPYEGHTPLFMAVRGGELRLARELLRHEADPSIPGLRGDTPLHEAVRRGSTPMMRLLLDNKAPPSIQNEQGDTPLHEAARRGNLNATRLLVEYDASPAIQNSNGDTPIHEAVRRGNRDMVELLVAAEGADILLKNKERLSALDLADPGSEIRRLLLDARTGRYPLEEEDILGYLPSWMHTLVSVEFMGVALWRFFGVALVILLVLVLNTILKHYLAQASKSADQKEGLDNGTAPASDEDTLTINPEKARSFLALSVLAARRGLKILIWGLALEFAVPLLLPFLQKEADYIGSVLFSLALAVFLFDYVDVLEYYMNRYAKRTKTKLDEKIVPLFKKSLRIVVVVVAGLQIYQTVSGNSIASVIAGLGIGAMAVALAATDTLKNLIGFVMILLDKPYAIGERIIFDGHDGIVEQIGVRTTRLRRLDGHVACIPNSKAVDSVLHNVAKRPYIKRSMDITITYDTPVAKIEEALQIVKEILHNHEGMNPERPPRVYFSELNADSLSIAASYWYHPAEYYDYMAFSEKVNLELMRRFEAAGIEFAFPTQTLYLAGDPNRKFRIETVPATGHPPASP